MSRLTEAAARQHVVIVGGGFGGLNAARRLARHGFTVTLFDKRNFQLFQPLLYQVATGALSTGDIATPLRHVLRDHPRVTVLQSTAYDVRPAERVLVHEHGETPYDALIVATGVTHHYFGHEEWRPFAPGLKTVEHALEIRRKLFDAFEKAELSNDAAERARLLTFVIVGGGPTGVEMAGAIGELAHHTLRKDFRRIDPASARVVLIEGEEHVLPVYGGKLSDAARKSLEKLGVTVLTKARVKDLRATGVTYEQDGQRVDIDTRTVLWAAGVRASAFGEILGERTGVGLDRGGRVRVQPDCSLPGHPEIFVIGDLARLTDARGVDVPGLAQGAIQEGQYVADVLRARVKASLDGPAAAPQPFRYKDLGSMAVIGTNHAVGDLGFAKVTGFVAWLLWAGVHIAALVSPNQRLRVTLQWLWKYVTRSIGDRLITGRTPDARELHAARVPDSDLPATPPAAGVAPVVARAPETAAETA